MVCCYLYGCCCTIGQVKNKHESMLYICMCKIYVCMFVYVYDGIEAACMCMELFAFALTAVANYKQLEHMIKVACHFGAAVVIYS